MSWYTVVKTIKGRRYLYLQMTYRAGGKVRTKNKYLGPASARGASFGFGAPSNLPLAETRIDTTTPPDPLKRAKAKTVHAGARKALKEARRKLPYQLAAEHRAYKNRLRSHRIAKRLKSIIRKAQRIPSRIRAFADNLLPDVGQARSIDRFVEKQATEAPAESAPAGAGEKGEKAE